MNEKISRVLDIPIEITAILGRTKMSLNEILEKIAINDKYFIRILFVKKQN